MKIAIRVGLLVLALGAVLPAASHAIIFFCDDICGCTTSCGIFCYEYDGGPRMTCGSAGYDCTGSPGCLGGSPEAVSMALPEFLASRSPASSVPPVRAAGLYCTSK